MPTKQKSVIPLAAAILILPSLFVPFLTVNAAIAPNSPAGAGSSLNWSGYETTGGTYTSVGANWIVPNSTAPAGATVNELSADATWVGIGGVSSRDLIQAGTQTVFQNGSPSYQAWYETLPADSEQVPLTIHPGDAMTVSLVEQSNGIWIISFSDATTGQSYNTTVSYQSSLSSAEWIEEMPSTAHGFVALDNFGTAAFTNGFTIENGAQLTLANADAQPLTMITSADQALATPSSLGADGASFSVTRTSVAASTAALAPTIVVGRGGRWTRTGVGVQGYTAPTRTVTVRSSTVGSGGVSGNENGFGYFRFGFGNFNVFFRTFENNFREGRDR
jgi:hypothetical protein